MEALENAIAREGQRLSRDILKPKVVTTLSDIKTLLKELDPANNKQQSPLGLKTTMEVRDDGGLQTFAVQSTTRSKSKRDILIEGFDIIKRRQDANDLLIKTTDPIEINGRFMPAARVGNGIDGISWIDPLLHKWLGATREGLMICWLLNDGYKYQYCIYNHKLTRVPRDGKAPD